jgi:hypothetical protein
MKLLIVSTGLIISLASFVLIPHKSLNLAAIDAHVQKIQEQAGYSKQVQKDMWGYSTQGGEMIAYLDKANYPMLITTTMYGERGKSTDSLYYWNKQLCYTKSVDSYYDKSIYWEGGPVNIIKEEVYTAYFRPSSMDYLFMNGKAITDSVLQKNFQDDMFKSSSMYLDSCRL